MTFALLASNLTPSVRAASQHTRIASPSAYAYGPNQFVISGRLENRSNTEPALWSPLRISERIELSWFTVENPTARRPISETWTDASTGSFQYSWFCELEPSSSYRIYMDFRGDTTSSTTFNPCNATTSLYVPLMLSVTLEDPTLSVLQDESATTTVTVSIENSKALQSISLSAPNWPSNLYGSAAFTQTHGTASLGNPFKSLLKIFVKNQTQPGMYYVTVSAVAATGATAQAKLTVYVQQNVYTICVIVKGLPSNVSTKIFADKAQIGEVRGDRTVSLIVSNKTMTVSVLREPPSGNALTLYLCEDNVRNTVSEAGVRVTEFTFQYATLYAVKFTANVAPELTLTIRISVETSETQKTFKPTQGYTTQFYPEGTKMAFAIVPAYIPTENDVNYKFNMWKNDRGEVIEANSEGVYEITLTRPYELKALFDRYVAVKIKADPIDLPIIQLRAGLKGSDKKIIEVSGPTALSLGEFLAESTLELSMNQSQYALTNAKADTRYIFDGFSPSNEVLLRKHLTIVVRYKVYFRVRVESEFTDAVIQPRGGESWYLKGSLAAVQVTGEAWGFEIINGWRPLRYVFERWTGAIESNRTQPAPFPVLQPMEIKAIWKLDLQYLALIGAACSGLIAGSTLGLKRFVIPKAREKLQERRIAKKIAPIGNEGAESNDMKLLHYVNRKKGVLKWSEVVKELEMSRDQIQESIRRLREAKLLGANPRFRITMADAMVLDYVNRKKGALRLSEATKDLEMSRDQIQESIRRLMEARLLGEAQGL